MAEPESLTALKDPAVIVIFGITGDLARNKVLPALYHLFKNNLVNEHTYLVGTSRHVTDPQHIVDKLQEVIEANGETIDKAVLNTFHGHLSMLQLDPEQGADYDKLNQHLHQVEESINTCLEWLFYLSIPPQVFGTVVEQLGQHDLHHGCMHEGTGSRLLIEKPFGYDTASAQALIAKTGQYFNEDQLYRIDHYLAKETAQNILTFRQQNPLFNQIWNYRHITKISITAAESIGIEGRGNFYDQIGALRDLIQSHLIQLLALTIMELPTELTADSIHAAKQLVLDSLLPVPAEQVSQRTVRGQYATYRQEVDNHDSTTETYAAIVLYSRQSDWQNVPFHLTSGKGLKLKRTSITIDFGAGGINRLQFRIQPNEGITLNLQVKQPGLAQDVRATKMEFDYQTAFQLKDSLDAYERVLIEAMRSDHTLFTTNQEVLTSWEVLQPVIDAWQASGDGLVTYESGSDGPDVSQLNNDN